MDDFLAIFTLLLFAAVLFFFVTHFVSAVVEPVYMAVFKKPVYVYFYPVLKTLPDEQRHFLENNFTFYRKLSEKKKRYFEHRMFHFLERYRFFGKNGLVVTDEMRVMIAATYIMLTFGFRVYLFDVFDKIVIYPDSYHSTIKDEDHNGEFNPQVRAIVFSWKHFAEGYALDSDNLNLGIHEFTHAIHYYGLQKKDNAAALFAKIYEQILVEINYPANKRKLIESNYFRIYAYTNSFEFIAVLLEHFFETPEQFRREFPVLYDHVRVMINYSGN